jgi:glucokinase
MLSSTPGGEAKHLPAALEQGDAVAEQLLKEIAEDLAFGLSHATHLFHPKMIILGGGLAGIGEPLRAAVGRALPQFVMDAFAPGPRITLSELREDAVPMGAIELADRGRGP